MRKRQGHAKIYQRIQKFSELFRPEIEQKHAANPRLFPLQAVNITRDQLLSLTCICTKKLQLKVQPGSVLSTDSGLDLRCVQTACEMIGQLLEAPSSPSNTYQTSDTGCLPLSGTFRNRPADICTHLVPQLSASCMKGERGAGHYCASFFC